MKRIMSGLRVLPVLLCVSSASLAQSNLSLDGRAIAIATCGECHATGANGGVSKNSAAPAFSAIAAMPSATPLSIKVFLRSSHETMPNIILSDIEIEAVATYILGLKVK